RCLLAWRSGPEHRPLSLSASSSPVLSVPALRAWMQRDIHRRGLALAPHLQGGAARTLLPGDLRFARGKRAADVVGHLVRQRRVGVDRPAAEIERVDVAIKPREAGFWERYLAPSQPPHGVELTRLERDRRETGGQRLVAPDLDALVEHRVDRAA